MEIDVNIESGIKELTARDLSRWLVCVASIRDALAMMSGTRVTWYEFYGLPHNFVSRPDRLYYVESANGIRGPFPLLYYFRQLGHDLLSDGLFPSSLDARAFAKRSLNEVDDHSQEIADFFRPDHPLDGNPLEILSVTKGSITTRVKDGIDWIAGHLRDLLGSANGFIQAKNRDEFYKLVPEIARSSASDGEEIEISVGLLVASGLSLEEILATLRAKRIAISERHSNDVAQG